MGRVTSVTVLGRLTPTLRRELQEADLDLAPVSLQQLVVRRTTARMPATPAPTTPEGALR
jgi:ABC-2 type transport system ATP-binding protein